MTCKDLGLLLREMRESASLSQITLGQHLDRSQSAISKAELGETGLDVEDIGSWATMCGRQIVLRLGEGAEVPGEEDGLEGLPAVERALLLRVARALTVAGPSKALLVAQLEVVTLGVERLQAKSVVDGVNEKAAARAEQQGKSRGGVA